MTGLLGLLKFWVFNLFLNFATINFILFFVSNVESMSHYVFPSALRTSV